MRESICTIKLPLYPSPDSARAVDGQSKICNWLSNHLLDKANALREKFIKTSDKEASRILYTKRGFRNELTALKKEKPFLQSVHSSPLKNTALRLSKSIRAYQDSRKGKRRGKAIGWPKYKSFKREFFSLHYDEPFKGYAVGNGFLKLSFGLGEERKQNHIQISMPDSKLLKNKVVKNLTVTKETGSYFAIFTISRAVPEQKTIKRVIALDPNHKNLAYGVDNDSNALEIESPHWLKHYDKRFDELKSRRDRCKRKSKLIEIKDEKGEVQKRYWQPSRRYQKYQSALERARAKRREQIKTYRYTVAHALCKRYDLISIGDYTPQGGGISKKMRRGMNNRSTIGEFKKVLFWCSLKSGKGALEYNEEGTTRTCHACLHKVEGGLSPKIRFWVCENCSWHHFRDENSGINGLRITSKQERAPSILGAVPSSGPVRIRKRWAWRVLPSGVQTLRGKDGPLMGNCQEIKQREWYPSIRADQDCLSFVQV
jgi:putative transposase